MDSTANSCRLLLDIGGTFVKSVVADRGGELLPGSEFTHPMPSDGTRDEICDSLEATVARGVAFAERHGLRIAGIGIAVPGPFDYAAGIPRMTHKFAAVNGLSLADVLRALPGVGPQMRLGFVHDVNAVLLGELAHGNARGFRNAAVVTLGTGLGFACCLDGEVQYSPLGSPRISIYNRPCRDGILEDWVAKRGFLRIYCGLTDRRDPALTVADLARMAVEGDAAARETFAAVGALLAESLGNLLAELQIGCLLFGGQISRSFALLEPALREGLRGVACLERIAPVAHIGHAAFYGVLAGMDGVR